MISLDHECFKWVFTVREGDEREFTFHIEDGVFGYKMHYKGSFERWYGDATEDRIEQEIRSYRKVRPRTDMFSKEEQICMKIRIIEDRFNRRQERIRAEKEATKATKKQKGKPHYVEFQDRLGRAVS